jgi:hypothetical protein
MNEENIWLEYIPMGRPLRPGAPKMNSRMMFRIFLSFILRLTRSNRV